MKAPDIIETARLRLRRPAPDDVDAIYSRYASDADVTKFLGWPRHASIEDTRAFLEFSRSEWERKPAGPYLIELPDGRLIGGNRSRLRDSASFVNGLCACQGRMGLWLCHGSPERNGRSCEDARFASR